MDKLRHSVFWPSLLLLLGGLGYTLVGGDPAIDSLNSFLRASVKTLALPLGYTATGSLLLSLLVAASPIGAVRLGGPEAERELTLWQYFSIALCTTVAVGILFWAPAEPLFHLLSPPRSLGLTPLSVEAEVFAMSTLLQHWTLIPYALYAVPAVLFALAFYNMGRPFRLSSALYPLLGRFSSGPLGLLVDTVCLFALVAGMAASLGAGILTLSGGLQALFGIAASKGLWILIGASVVASFVLSAVSGLNHGVRILSDINAKVFFVILAVIALFGPSGERLALTFSGVLDFFLHLLPRGLLWEFQIDDPWLVSWPLFNWTNWMAWAPMTALFLGRISKGYTVRQMLLFTLVLPSLFVTLWMGILGGSALQLQRFHSTLVQAVGPDGAGPESVIYTIFAEMPASTALSALFVVGVFLSYVTAADSNTLSMAGLCWEGVSAEDPEPPTHLKVLWGLIVGTLSVVMICSKGLNGVKALSNLGGLPALFYQIACCLSLVVMIVRWKRFREQ